MVSTSRLYTSGHTSSLCAGFRLPRLAPESWLLTPKHCPAPLRIHARGAHTVCTYSI